MIMEYGWSGNEGRKLKYSDVTVPQYHFVYHKSHNGKKTEILPVHTNCTLK
jgi:hypothetical protein